MQVDDSKNTGLSSDFYISDGKFSLTGGIDKCINAVSFHMQFMSWHRIYFSDFIPDLSAILQKPNSVVEAFRTIILGNIKKSFDKYSKSVIIDRLNVERNPTNLKEYGFLIQYTPIIQREQTLISIQIINL